MNDEQPLAPTSIAAPLPPAPDPFHVLAYEPLMTRIKAAQLKPLIIGLLAALGFMALGNILMFALVQQAQQETVDYAATIAANSEGGDAFLQNGEGGASRMAAFGPLADLIDSITEKERRRDALLAQRPEFAGDLPIANAPDWRALAAQQLNAYDDQVDAQIAILAKGANVATAESIAPSSLGAPALSLPLPSPSSAVAKPLPSKQRDLKQKTQKQASAKRSTAQTPAAKRPSDSNYARELTAALNRAALDQAPAEPAAAPDTPPAPIEAAPIATTATTPVAPEAVTPASDELAQ